MKKLKTKLFNNNHKLNNKSGFTLVELIVVITILAILGTIAFMAFKGYAASSRDAKRISDIKSIRTSLELFGLNIGRFPDPNTPHPVTFSGSEIRSQGTFGEQNLKNIGNINKLPVDPLTELEYTYSVTHSKNEFELGAILETNNILSLNTINQVNALNKKKAMAYIKGNYNGRLLRKKVGNTTYILAIPSIINGDYSLSDIINLINVKHLAYNGYSNLPASYTGTIFEVNGEDDLDLVNPSELVVFNGNIDELTNPEDPTARIELIKNIKEAYEGTDIENQGGIEEIVNIDFSSPDSEPLKEYIAGTLVNNEFGGEIKVTPVSIPSNSGSEGGSEEGDGEEGGGEVNTDPVDKSVCGGTHYNPESSRWTDDSDCAEATSCEYTYEPGEDDDSYCNVDDGCDCWWKVKTPGQTACESAPFDHTTLNTYFGEDNTKEEWCSLSSLYKSGVGLDPELPTEIGNLVSLTELNLEDNQLTSIPESFGNLVNLKILDLGYSNFTTLPESIGNLEKLEELNLDYTNLNSLPESFGNLTNLKNLNLYNNKLASLPDSIINLKNLLELNLSNNPDLGEFSDYYDIRSEKKYSDNITPTGKIISIESFEDKLLIKAIEAGSVTSTTCGPIPDYATATTVTTYEQTYNGTTWEPIINWGENQEVCGINCNTNYTWNGTSCNYIYPNNTTNIDGSATPYITDHAGGSDRFTDNGNGTTLDKVTGLIWQKAASTEEQNICKTYDTLENTSSDSECRDPTYVYGDDCNWCAAKTYCANLELGGYTDWRLPDSTELGSIIDLSRVNPSLDNTYFTTNSSGELFYWTSTMNRSSTTSAQNINFTLGYTVNNNKYYNYYVRCVR